MTTYKITIKDNSIPEHVKEKAFKHGYIDISEYTAIIECPTIQYIDPYQSFFDNIKEYISDMATELNTDPESLEILSIIKQ